MKILVVNAGSSSMKFQLLNTETEEILAKGNVERIGEGASFLSYKRNGESYKFDEKIDDHSEAVKLIFKTLTNKQIGALKSIDEVDAIGHRVVNAGDKYFDPIKADADVVADFKTRVDFSPLHMPGAIAGLEASMKVAPRIPNVCVFDIGFHKTMPDYAYRYAIANKYYDEYKIRRYGAHGTSHYYVTQRTADILHKELKDLKIITCHLGGGSSICAVNGGKSVDTSMGFTPLEGVIMNTRSGDIDASVVEFLCKKLNVDASEVVRQLNKESGLYGLNDGVSDMRELTSAENINTPKVKLALDMYAYRVKKYIGAYTASMNGLDAIVFTAGIGEYTPELRERICANMDFFGIKIDNEKNYNAPRGKEFDISGKGSKVKVLIVPTNEELVIAKQTEEVITKK